MNPPPNTPDILPRCWPQKVQILSFGLFPLFLTFFYWHLSLIKQFRTYFQISSRAKLLQWVPKLWIPKIHLHVYIINPSYFDARHAAFALNRTKELKKIKEGRNYWRFRYSLVQNGMKPSVKGHWKKLLS